MPGLSQLKKFNADILSLGNEQAKRAARGEKPVTVPIPKGTKDTNDADDFLMGMPEPVEYGDLDKPVDNGPEDFSDIMGLGTGSSSGAGAASADASSGSAINLSMPDLSSLGAFEDNSSSDGMDAGVPDLSMFAEPVEESEPEPEPEPEEPEIADLSLEDLLGGAGFDGSQGEGEYQEPTDDENLDSLENADTNNTETSDIGAFDGTPAGLTSIDDSDSLDNPDTTESLKDSDFSDISGIDLDAPDFSAEPEQNAEEKPDLETASDNSPSMDSIPEFDLGGDTDSFEIPDGFLTESPENIPEEDGSGFENQPSVAEGEDLVDAVSLNSDGDEIKSPEATKADEEFAFDGPAIDMGEGLPDSMTEINDVPVNTEKVPADAEENISDAGFDAASPEGLFDTSDFEMPEMDSETAAGSDFGNGSTEQSVSEQPASDEFNMDSKSGGDSGDFASDDFEFDPGSLSLDDMDAETSGTAAFDTESSDAGASADSDGEMPSDFNFEISDDDIDAPDTFQESAPSENFDTTEMDGLDFGIQDTDSALEKGNFELGNSEDFASDNGDFEIPGFSDVQTVEVNKNGKIKIPAKEEEQPEADENENLPPNTLSDEQYARFLKNLSTYPLNVRMAVEELIVKNEFTDEAEFGIVQKVLKRVSARQLAGELEKMLDIAIPVPRDFERRTAEEYEAYKQSFQYQLSNKILPGAIVSVAAVIVCFFLFQFARFYIYRPARANSLYKQGYRLLEAEDFPQSETKFTEATKFQLQKKWFFNYAHGYRNHRQYIRAEQMYKNILYCFKYDKTAGLEYAGMELNDLANYEKAEEILLRDVLDHHINDADGILLLGDNYLEWACEKDPSKFEEARKRYSELVQLYGPTDKNMSRMMRYFIRTDNLREVLSSKERFFPRPKSLEPADWTDLSGYCLEKLYGPLAPADEYLRTKIEDVKEMLVRAVKADRKNPVAYYNMSKYYVNTNNPASAEGSLKHTISAFDKADSIKRRDMYKFIDAYRLLGEIYVDNKDYLKALESFSEGVGIYTNAHTGSGLEGNRNVGKLYSNVGDIEYFIAGDYDAALQNYQDAVDTDYDIGQIRYKIGYIQYSKKNYGEAIGSFMKASEDFADDPNLLLAMGNTLSLRNDNYAAEGYYERLLEQIGAIREQRGVLFPQVRKDEEQIVDSYMKASNNLGVTLFRLARRTGSSSMNASAMVNLQESLRAWDSMTRNQQTMVRLGGSNLAEQNLKYVTHPMPEYEPAIYTDLPHTLSIEKGLAQ